jgi:hypothetical protein
MAYLFKLSSRLIVERHLPIIASDAGLLKAPKLQRLSVTVEVLRIGVMIVGVISVGVMTVGVLSVGVIVVS